MFNIMSIERAEEDVEVDVDKDAEELFWNERIGGITDENAFYEANGAMERQ